MLPPSLPLLKKKTIRAAEQNETARAAWREQAKSLSSDLVFVDETGSHSAMTPLYAYAPRGERAIGNILRNYGAIMTLIASMSMQGMGEALILDPTDCAPMCLLVKPSGGGSRRLIKHPCELEALVRG
jgi:hypothetical protein